ncbi:MAG: hypothetical protein V2B18_16690 [Pseudomonadota bacterium]
MKIRIIGLLAGLFCLLAVCMSFAQQKSSLPEDVCNAIEQYVAQITVAGTGKDKAARLERYSSALKALTEVLKRHKKDDLLKSAEEFAKCTEDVAGVDPTNAKFGEFTQKKLLAGSALKALCMP